MSNSKSNSGLLELSSVSSGERQGTPWTGHQSITWPHTDKQPCTLTLTPRDNLVTDQPNMHVFGLWQEAGVPGENPRLQGENMQSPHRKAPVAIRTRRLEAMVLTTTPLRSPGMKQ